MRRFSFVLIFLFIVGLIPSLPTLAITTCTLGDYTVTGNVNVRAGATTSANIVTVLHPGAVVEVTGERQGTSVGSGANRLLWCAVTVSTSVGARNGYVHSSLLTTPTGAVPINTTGGSNNTANTGTGTTGDQPNQSTGPADLGAGNTPVPQPTVAPVQQSPASFTCPANCAGAVAMGLTAQQAATCPRLDRDHDGVACYGD